MKKIDLHVHTKSTISDSDFELYENALYNYVHECSIDAIAITNHNCFDLDQYEKIVKLLPDIVVFPGIEINIGIERKGHLIVIADNKDYFDFYQKCLKVKEKIKTNQDFVDLQYFRKIFNDLEKYILIPHYEKKPKVEKNIIKDLKEYIQCGEVDSIKKFMYTLKGNEITPVIFSDYRPGNKKEEFPTRQTYIDASNLSIQSIKKALFDKKVSLSPENGNQIFEILPKLPISTGLNVILGERSSGKTHTLNAIYKAHPNCKYIKQFSLLEMNENDTNDKFKKRLIASQSEIEEKYLLEFGNVVSDIKTISLDDDIAKLDDYIKSLKAHADEINRADAFSKCMIYSEGLFVIDDTNNLGKIISAVETLLNARKYQSIIEDYIGHGTLVQLYNRLVEEKYILNKEILKKKYANVIIKDIKTALEYKSAQTNVLDCNFYQLALNRKKVGKFKEIVSYLKKDSTIYKEKIANFTTIIDKRQLRNATEIKTQIKSNCAFSDAFKKYKDAYGFLEKLKEIDGLSDSLYYKCFVYFDHKLLNTYGYEVSGGERAEYNLIQEIDDAKRYDMLLIDEPESSFDNMFLKNSVNSIIKQYSKKMPVIIVTHNNTVGATIKPDYIIYTKRIINQNNDVDYRIYYGNPDQKELKDKNGNTIENISVILNCLEAGKDAYDERGKEYEMLENL